MYSGFLDTNAQPTSYATIWPPGSLEVLRYHEQFYVRAVEILANNDSLDYQDPEPRLSE
jgi:hypothetical protein